MVTIISYRRVEAYYNKGTVEFQRKNYDEALRYLLKSLELNPLDVEIYTNISAVYLEKGEFKKVIDICNEAITVDSNHIVIRINKAMAYVHQGEFDKGIESLKEVLKIAPDDSQTQNLIANIIKQKEQQKILFPQESAYSNNAITKMRDAISLLQRGDFEGGKKTLELALAIEPKMAEAWFTMGQIEFQAKNYAKSINYLNKALELKPTLELAWSTMGSALDQLGMYKKAIQCYDEALNINSNCSPALNNKALALDMLGKYQEAIECYSKSLDLYPHKAGNWFNKGETHTKIGEYEKALQCYLEVLKIDPTYKEAQEMVNRLRERTSSQTINITCPRCKKINYIKSSHCAYCKQKI